MQDSPTATTAAREPVRQISVFLDNRVGRLRSLIKLITDHHIAVIGLSLQEAADVTIVRLVLSDVDSAATLFMERGIAHTDSRVVVVELLEDTLTLEHCLGVLLEAEINIRACFPLMNRPGRGALLALHLDDPDTGDCALHNAGFKVLAQSELSR